MTKHPELLDTILAHTAKQDTPLTMACRIGSPELVRRLLELKATVNKAKADGASPLFIAAQEGHMHVIPVLLAAGADVHQRRRDGATALDICGPTGRKPQPEVRRLLEQHVEQQAATGSATRGKGGSSNGPSC